MMAADRGNQNDVSTIGLHSPHSPQTFSPTHFQNQNLMGRLQPQPPGAFAQTGGSPFDTAAYVNKTQSGFTQGLIALEPPTPEIPEVQRRSPLREHVSVE